VADSAGCPVITYGFGWTERHEDGNADVDATAVKRLERIGNEPGRYAGTHSRLEAVPRIEVSRVAALEFRDGEDVR